MNDRICCLILNYNDYEETIECVNNLIELDEKNKLLIIIVDNNSTNNSYSILKENYGNYEKISLIKSEKNGGYSSGNNVGFKFINQNFPEIKFTILMNPDTRLHKLSDVDAMENAFEFDEKLAIVAPVVILNGKINYKITAWNAPKTNQILRLHCKFLKYETKQYINESSKGLVYVDAVQGGFFMVRMSALVDIGFIDENIFLYSEEVLLSKDLKKIGYKEAVLTNVFFDHNHKDNKKKITLKNRLKQEKNFYNSRNVYCKKHLGIKACRLLKIVHLLNYMYIVITHPIIKCAMERKNGK